MLENYSNAKKTILDFAEKVKAYPDLNPTLIANSTLNNEISNLESEEFKIALIAPFSAGKSTFINSLIGDDLLSMEITAETAVITKIKHSELVKLELIFNDGRPNELYEDWDNNEGSPKTQFRNMIENKTTVKGDNNDVEIKEAIVHYPIELCRNGVELIDTPGLFARYENHEAITTGILPLVNAVIFMIDPESVGEEHFTEVIQNYVRNAKNSNLDADGSHIFFVINKIDKFNEADIQKARNELKIVLENIISRPKILEISAYYGMKGKMFLSNKLELIEIQKDRKINLPDPEDPDYSISGRNITKETAGFIYKFSKVGVLEKELSSYLENKNKYLIDDINLTLKGLIIQSQEELKFMVEELKNAKTINVQEYRSQLESLRTEIKQLREGYQGKISNHINKRLRGGTSGKGIRDKINERIQEETEKVSKDLVLLLNKEWRRVKLDIKPGNAESIIEGIISRIEQDLMISSKEIAKNSFNYLKSSIKELSSEIQDFFDNIKREIELKEYELAGKKIGELGSINLDNLMNSVQKTIETIFSDFIITVSKGTSRKVRSAQEKSTTKEEKNTFFYKIKVFFTRNKEYNTVFDPVKYRDHIENTIDEIEDEIKRLSSITAQEKLISPVREKVDEIFKILETNLSEVMNNIIKTKEEMIKNIENELKGSVEEQQKLIEQKENSIRNIELLLNEYNTIQKIIWEN
jgi:GTPase SAR1 family protein